MMELMEIDLHKIISKSEQILTEAHIKCLMKQLLEGIKAMHSMKICHRDIKPANILVNQDCQLRITDFGLARFMGVDRTSLRDPPPQMTEYVVTRWYRAPELLIAPSNPYSELIDIWSAGCILAEMTSRRPLFPGQGYIDQVQQIFSVVGLRDAKDLGFPVSASNAAFLNSRCRYAGKSLARMFPSLSTEALDLLESLLTVNPTLRPSAEHALTFPFFNDAEVLFDYSKVDIAAPPADYFEFESKKFDRISLGNMIRNEVAEFNSPRFRLGDGDFSSHTTATGRTSIESGDLFSESEFEASGEDFEISVQPDGQVVGNLNQFQEAGSVSDRPSTAEPAVSVSSNNPFGKQHSAVKRRVRTFPADQPQSQVQPQVQPQSQSQSHQVKAKHAEDSKDSKGGSSRASKCDEKDKPAAEQTGVTSKFSKSKGYPFSKLRQSLYHKMSSSSGQEQKKGSMPGGLGLGSEAVHLPAISSRIPSLADLEEGKGQGEALVHSQSQKSSWGGGDGEAAGLGAGPSTVSTMAITSYFNFPRDRTKRFSIDEEDGRQQAVSGVKMFPPRRLSSLLSVNPILSKSGNAAMFEQEKERDKDRHKSKWTAIFGAVDDSSSVCAGNAEPRPAGP